MAEKRITIKDVAKLARVSVGAVSFVLNNTPGQSIPEATRQRVLEAVRKLGYTPNAIARGMRTRKSRAIGLVSFWDITEHAFVEILNGVYRIAGEHDYTTVLCSLNPKDKGVNYVELFNGQLIDGVIFISPYDLQAGFDENDHVEALIQNKIPSVILYGHTKHEKMSYINVDHYSTTYLAAKYLSELGHRKIGYLLPGRHEAKEAALQRFRGFEESLKACSLEQKEAYIFSLEDVDRITRLILNNEGPTGIVAYKCDYAHKFLKSMLDNGIKVPERISVIAANTTPYAQYLYPPLTSVQLPFEEMGEKAVEVLLESFGGRVGYKSLELKGKLCIRASCKSIM